MDRRHCAGPSHRHVEEESPQFADVENLVMIRTTNDYYSLTKKLGQGAFGKVYLAFGHRSRRHVAIKIFMTKNKSAPAREFDICRMFIGVENIIQTYELFVYKDRACMAFEFMQESLFDFIRKLGPFSIKTIRPLVRQLLEALKALKAKHIMHTDIKPVNIMITHWSSSGRVLKLIDLGAAIFRSQARRNCLMQTRPYRAPEVILGADRTEKIDMWSSGCVLAEMLSRRILYNARNDNEQLAMITKFQGPLPDNVLLKGIYTYHLYNLVSTDGRQFSFQLGGSALPMAGTSNCFYFPVKTKSLQQLVEYDGSARQDEKIQMHSLLKSMLYLDPDLRCSPEMALNHKFFSMEGNVASGDRK